MKRILTPEEAKMKRERHRSLVNRKYKMDLYWILLSTLFFFGGIYFMSVYAPLFFNLIDAASPVLISGFVLAGSIIATLLLKIAERSTW